MNKTLSRRAVFQGIFAAPFGAGLAGAQTPAELKAASRIIEVNGRAAKVFGIVNGGGGNGLSLMLGERFRARVKNDLNVETLLHWHGLNPPSDQDGVPMLSQAALKAGSPSTTISRTRVPAPIGCIPMSGCRNSSFWRRP